METVAHERLRDAPREDLVAMALVLATAIWCLPARAPVPQLLAAITFVCAANAFRRRLGVAFVAAPLSIFLFVRTESAWGDVVAGIGLVLALSDGFRRTLGRGTREGLKSHELRSGSRAQGPWFARVQMAYLPAICAVFAIVLGRTGSPVGALGCWCLTWMVGLAIILGAAAAHRLDLRYRPRLVFATGLWLALGLLGLALEVSGGVPARAGLRVALSAAAAAVTWMMSEPSEVKVEKVSRTALVMTLVAIPLLALGYAMTAFAPTQAPLITVIIALCTLFAGTMHVFLETPFLPWQGKFLLALRAAADELATTLEVDALRRALYRIREPQGPQGRSPLLFFFDPEVCHSVDAAGYLHTRVAKVPFGMLELCLQEPYGTLRTEALAALEVRNPEMRPAVAWLRQHGALSITVVRAEGTAIAALVLPKGLRSEDLAASELVRLEPLLWKLASCKERAMDLSRSHARQHDIEASEERERDEKLATAHVVERIGMRNLHATVSLARDSAVGVYSSVSRFAWDALEKRVSRGASLLVLVGRGDDAVPWIAHAYARSPKKYAPLVVVDGTESREHDLARWADPSVSPLALADGGLLVLRDARALPEPVQDLIARAHGDRRPPWESAVPLELQLAITLCIDDNPKAVKAAANAREKRVEYPLSSELLARLLDAVTHPIALPRLNERADDLRAVFQERIAREALRTRGRTMGLAPAALGKLVELPFAAGEAELNAWVVKLVAVAEGDTVELRHLVDVGIITAFDITPAPANVTWSPAAVPSAPGRPRGRKPKLPLRKIPKI